MEKKKKGLPLAVSMVVGIVIGSGIFFKADNVLTATKGDFNMAIVAWLIGGVAMVFGALAISEYAKIISKSNGLVDYFEETFGKISEKAGEVAGYIVGWFMAVTYYPALAAVVSWVAGLYTAILFDLPEPGVGTSTWVLTVGYMLLIFLSATFTRKISETFQISATIIKLIPLALVAVVGIIYGTTNGTELSAANFEALPGQTYTFVGAVVATAFAFDGWIAVTSINDEIANPKRNLPLALVIGTLVVIVIYITYFTGVISVVGGDTILSKGDAAVTIGVKKLFGNFAGSLLTVFIIISCLGTVNGLTMAGTVSAYQLSLRGHGISPKSMSKKEANGETAPTIASAIFFLVVASVMLLIWYLGNTGNLGTTADGTPRFIDVTSVPIVMVYIFFAVLYINMMMKFTHLNFVQRFLFPILALGGAGVVIYGGFTDPNISLFMMISIGITVVGLLFFNWKKFNK